MNYLESKYISLISSRLTGFTKVGSNANFRCPVCNDSEKDKRKKRGWLLCDKDTPVYYCHNCGRSMSFVEFLKFMDPSLHKEYIYELMKERSGQQKSPEPEIVFKKPVFQKEEKSFYLQAFLSVCTPLNELPDEHPAIKYISGRNLPEDKWKYLYYIENVQDVHKLDKNDKYKNRIVDNDPRIIIPIWGKNSLIGLSCRSLQKDPKRRYLIFKFEEDKPLIFNLYDINGKLVIDTKKPIYITEGGLDSLFLENAVSVNGSDLKRVMKMFVGLKTVFCPDNEPRNKEIVKVYKDIINSNNDIVIFPNTIDSKDINDMINKFGREKILDVINKNTFHGAMASLRFQEWKRC